MPKTKADEIRELAKLKEEGLITEAEYAAQKTEILAPASQRIDREADGLTYKLLDAVSDFTLDVRVGRKLCGRGMFFPDVPASKWRGYFSERQYREMEAKCNEAWNGHCGDNVCAQMCLVVTIVGVVCFLADECGKEDRVAAVISKWNRKLHNITFSLDTIQIKALVIAKLHVRF
jgi:hypothetical protein